MEKFCLNWNDFKQNASSAFNQLRNDKDLIDVTLVSEEGEHILAHKIVLSSSSDFFKDLFKKANHTNPLIFLSGFDSKVLTAVLDYIYNGSVYLHHEEIDVFLESAKKLKIHGLNQKLAEENIESTLVESVVENSILTGKSYQKKVNSNTTIPQENTCNKQESKVATIDSQIETKVSSYDDLIENIRDGWKCKSCGKTTKTKGNMTLHVEIHMDGLSFQCSSCTMIFRSRNHLNVHKNRIHGTTVFHRIKGNVFLPSINP